MTAKDLLKAFETLAEAPHGVARLRELILSLAVRGKLVPQDPTDEPASRLLEHIHLEKARLMKEGKLKKQEPLPPLKPEEIPFELPEGWEWVRLGESCINRDAERVPLSVEIRQTRRGAYDYYGASGVIDCIDDYLFDKPLLLVGEDGANLVLRSTPIAFIARGKYWVNNHAHVLDAIEEICLRYLAVFFNAIDLKPYVTGTAQPKLNQAKMNSIPTPLPPLSEQHRIVSRVDELMGLLDRLEAARAAREVARVAHRESALSSLRDANTPEEVEIAWLRVSEGFSTLVSAPEDVASLRQTVLQLAVRGKLVPQDPSDEPARQLLERIAAEKARLVKEGKIKAPKPLPPLSKDELPFELPRGWEWVRLGELVLEGPSNGWSPLTVDTPTDIRTLKLSATTQGRFEGRHFKYVDAQLAPDCPYWLSANDLLIQRSNTPEYVGMAAIYEGPDLTYIYPDLMMRCRLTAKVVLHFVHSALIAPFNRQWFKSKASGTSQSMVKLNQAAVSTTLIPLPPLSEQHRIVSRVDALMGLLDRLEGHLKETRDAQDAYASSVVVGFEG